MEETKQANGAIEDLSSKHVDLMRTYEHTVSQLALTREDRRALQEDMQ
jgi:hypothetical protein